MQHPSDGTLLCWLDAQLNERLHHVVGDHVDRCKTCQRRVCELRDRRDRTIEVLGLLDPGPINPFNRQWSLMALRATLHRRNTGTMWNRIRTNKGVQRILIGVAALVIVIGLLLLAPVRALASDFLALFRVEQFLVVDVDPERIEQIAEAIDEDMYFGEQELLEDPGEPVEVATLDEAVAMVGFAPRVPQGYGVPTSIAVSGRGRMRFTPEVETLRAVFETVGLDPDLMPAEIDGKPFDITIPASVVLTYNDGDPDMQRDFMVVQVPSPSVEVPEDVDMQALGEAMLQLIGMSPDEAARLSQSIDWTTTLVLPIPTNVSKVQEVRVDGTTGLLFDMSDYEDVDGGGGALLWQKEGFVFLVVGMYNSFDLLEVAESLP